MQKQQQKQKSQDYYIGYAQGYKDAVDDLKGWAIQKSDAPFLPPYITFKDSTNPSKNKWMAALSTNSTY